MTTRTRQLLHILAAHGPLSMGRIMAKADCTRNIVLAELWVLRIKGWVKRTGGAEYLLTELGRTRSQALGVAVLQEQT